VKPVPVLLLLVVAAPLAACDDDPTQPNFEYMPDMVSSVAFDSFDPNPVTADGRTLMRPPEGTIPRGYQPLHYGPGPAEALRAGRELVNPLPDSDLVRARGEIGFQRWCSPCHGHEGLGDGLVARKFPRPPPLTADHARGLPDGQIFHIVSFGQGVMPSYGQQVVAADRWKIVRYLRKLQAASGPVAASPAPPPPAPVAPPAPPPPAAPTSGGVK
jgi:mono/diheme cytochrome c family protein